MLVSLSRADCRIQLYKRAGANWTVKLRSRISRSTVVVDSSSSNAKLDNQRNKYGGKTLTVTFDHREQSTITAQDIQNLASSRSGKPYAELTDNERATYARVVDVLRANARRIVENLNTDMKLAVKETSGFSLPSGVRGRPPKDLWFAVFPEKNAQSLVANPQLFCIVSERGIEYGFGAVVHPSDFSNAATKQAVREKAPYVFSQLPSTNDETAKRLSDDIERSGEWKFLRKQRLTPGQTDFSSLSDWLDFLQSERGSQNAGGSISRFVVAEDLEKHDLAAELLEMARLFKPLIDIAWKTPNEIDEGLIPENIDELLELSNSQKSFAEVYRLFLEQFRAHRDQPYSLQNSLGEAKRELQGWLDDHASVRGRHPSLKVEISLGKGNWTKTPWIAFLDTRLTTTTTKGVYVVILISEDLSVSYLTLNQGMTELKERLGQRGAVNEMLRVAELTRPLVSEMSEAGFELDNNIDLKSSTDAAKNYEIGTIAHTSLLSDRLPNDEQFGRDIEAILRQYDNVIAQKLKQPVVADGGPKPAIISEPYSIDDATTELFHDREEIERYLSIWRSKKNLVLQGAPGVGKSFIARRLAYLLIGEKDENRIQSVQFHQSYSYEDFVQGYRPNGTIGFERRDGAFVDFRNQAIEDPGRSYVFIIDEINRGNLSKIFGELMLLIEPDKRTKEWATRLSYASENEEKFWVPENLFILGMMNTADRSLSMVDYALRRRFSFVTLDPKFGSPKFVESLEHHGIPNDLVRKLTNKLVQLNTAISDDKINLGTGYRVGHSFFTPTRTVEDPVDWYNQIIHTEVFPLLEEYWFDDPQVAVDWRDRLLAD